MTVGIRRDGFHVNGKRMDFISGEFHYWRVRKENWSKVLERIREMGVRAISTYVPWNFHEVDGEFDFMGGTDRQRDLNGFIDLVGKCGLPVLLRPGPYIYAEWKHAGATAEAFEYHRFSDQFKRLARPYIKAVCEVAIVPNLVTRGGPVFAVQVCNEIDPWVRFYRDQLGLSRGGGPFEDFLKGKYHGVEELNRAWHTEYSCFDEVESFEEHPGGAGGYPLPGGYRRYLDYRSFLDWAVDQICSWIADEYRKNGIDVPLVTNTYDDLTFHDLTRLRRVADLVCMDIYLRNNMPGTEFLKLSYWIKAYSAYSKYPIATEFQSGIWIDSLYSTGPIEGRHELLLGLASMAWGLKGWNWYMAVGRDNWTCAPINEWGLVNVDVYSSMKKVCELYDKIRPWELERLTSVALVHYRPQLLLKVPDKILCEGTGWGGCFRSLHDAGLDFTFYNPEVDEERRDLVIYSGGPLMDPEHAKALRGLAENGSHLVLLRGPPRMDFDGDRIGSFDDVPIPAGSRAEPRGSSLTVVVSVGSCDVKLSVRGFDFYDGAGGDDILLRGAPRTGAYAEGEPTLGEHVVGFSKRVGAGKITVMGLDPSREVIEFLTGAFKAEVPAIATTPHSVASLHSSSESTHRHVLFLVNNSTEEQIVSAKVSLPEGSYKFTAMNSIEQGTIEGGTGEIRVPVDWKSVEVVEIAQAR